MDGFDPFFDYWEDATRIIVSLYGQAGDGTGKWSGTMEFYRNMWEHINQATSRWQLSLPRLLW